MESDTEKFSIIPDSSNQPLKPLTPPSFFAMRIHRWQTENPIAFFLILPFALIFILISAVWALLMHRRVAAVVHVVLPLIAMTNLQQGYVILICLIRSLMFETTNYFMIYPSDTRRILSILLSAIETELLIHWDPASSSSLSSSTILALITCWILFFGEIWIWTSERHLEATEQKFISLNMKTATKCVSVAGISTLIVNPDNISPDIPVLVCCHGYASGKALYGSSLDALSQHFQVYCIDWLGFGRSSRKKKFHAATVEATEKYFVDSLEEWRIAMGFDKFHLLGHSMGGYLCAVYAIHHPERIHHLFLISPVGLPDVQATDHIRSTLLWSLLMKLWDWGITPIALWRMAGPFGPSLSRYACWLRYGSFMTRAESDATAAYLFHLNAGPLVGEVSITRLLHMGAWPRLPLGPRLCRLRSIPLTFMYGSSDWMDRAYASVVADDRRQFSDSAHCRIYIVPDAGHQVFVMNPTAFTKAVLFDALQIGKEEFKAVSDDDIVYLIERHPKPE